MVDASFTVEGNANPARHIVDYGQVINLELTAPNQGGIAAIQWSIPGTSLSTEPAPVITPSGSPSGVSAVFTMPASPSDIYGRSFRVRCVVKGIDGTEAEQFAIVGAANARGLLPLPAGELGPLTEEEDGEDRDGERNATHGYTDELNYSGLFSGGFTPSAPTLHTTLHSPVGLWQFNETLNDTSGNAFHFSLSTGVTRYVEIVPGLRGLKLFSTDKYNHAATGTALQIAGNMTIEMLLLLDSWVSGGGIATYDNVGETEADNVQYAVTFHATRGIQWFSEHGAGVDDAYEPLRMPPLLELCHLAVRRQSNVIQFFLNGRPFGAASSTLTTPTGGTAASLWLGFEGNPAASCTIASLKIIASALTDAQIEAEHDLTLGPWHGQR